MSADRITKIFLSADNTQKVRTLKGRTGLTPNILCRFALTLSLRDPGMPDPSMYTNDGMEFNSYTLLGQQEVVLLALVRQRCLQHRIDPDAEMAEQLRAHVNRGVGVLYPRVRSLLDLGAIVSQAQAERI